MYEASISVIYPALRRLLAGWKPASSLLGALTTRPVRDTRGSPDVSGRRLRERPVQAGVSSADADVDSVVADGAGLVGLLERGGLDALLDRGGLACRLDGEDEYTDALPPGRAPVTSGKPGKPAQFSGIPNSSKENDMPAPEYGFPLPAAEYAYEVLALE